MAATKTKDEHLRERILEYVLQLQLRVGVKGVKMDDVAADMGISKRTLYELFEDKAHLLLEVLRHNERQFHDFVAQVEQETDDVMEIYVRVARKKFGELKKLTPKFFLEFSKYDLVVQEFKLSAAQHRADTLAYFRKFVAQGYFRSDLNLAMLVDVFEAENRMLVEKGLFERYNFLELAGTLNDLRFRGICTQKGLDALAACLKRMGLQQTLREINNKQ